MLAQQAFAFYCLALGAWIVLDPESLFSVITVATGGWLSAADVRPDLLATQYGALCGFFYMYLGVVYLGLCGNDVFNRFSVNSRCYGVTGLLLLLIVLGRVPAKLFVFACIDVAFALWTQSALPDAKQA
jgi:hypothetical protein